ncbi:aminotransferase class V-fold PLP-dependent enzyme [Streptomyces sp. PH10-H1]|uniref:aminotransferase class V-fold PLP-dependent enzyme n=1 Tax=Streptomyces sp. PH10-H1 TaxID=3046212 RepID=UPI0024BB26F4|nr:aminotransferase class V-fold PLP-dependent enzyme [Streptomyces sp. PH10-H1]MDJ0340601.1 aminotransferase class V-fold PLP-dependent enzyme [Streptomyces sp. PH10-H1]
MDSLLSAPDAPDAHDPQSAQGAQSAPSLGGDAFSAIAPGTTYLNTASVGLPPTRTAEALRLAIDDWAAGRPSFPRYEAAVGAARASFARLLATSVERVAIGSTVSGIVGKIAVQLPPGSEVLVADGDFSSLVNPFAARKDLALRIAPLAELAGAVRPGTALVAVSAAQSADGRLADLPAIRAAAAAHGARTLIDASQAAGWLPLCADDFDYLVCGAFKWLLGPHGVSFLTVRPGAEDGLSPAFAGGYAGEDPWGECYGPITDLAASARQFDTSPAFLDFVATAESLALIEELGVDAIHAHDVALAARFRAGVSALGHTPIPARPGGGGADGSAIVAVPALPGVAADRLAGAGIQVSARAGNLRFSFHVYNSSADVDRALDVLGGM